MKESSRKIIYIVIALAVVGTAFGFGLHVGKNQMAIGNPQATNGDFVTADKFAPFWKEWGILNQDDANNASSSVDSKIYGAMQGLAASYNDPYTVFFPPAQSKMFTEDITGNFGGVGMEIGVKNSQIVVVSPIKGSPAEAAGVKTGDAILAIDGTSTAEMSVDEAVGLIRGLVGTPVTITFRPVGATKNVDRRIVRDVINIPTIDDKDQGNGVFMIRLYSFTSNSADLFRGALRDFVLSGDSKLIIDLRGNPGGYLESAWDIASYFIPAGKVIVTEDFGKNKDPNIFYSKGYAGLPKGLPVVVLVDGGSASASEILAGALKEQGVAKLVGTKTFGKGVVQELVPITDDTSLKVTIARWLTPLGHNLSHDGLDPDYNVTISDADVSAGKDPQLAKAMQVLTGSTNITQTNATTTAQ